MTRLAAERTSSRAIPPDVALRGQQLTLIEMSGGAGQDGLDLPERIAALEREVRYYRRVIPALARASANLRPPSREHAEELTHLARWLTDGQRVIGSVSRSNRSLRSDWKPSNEPTARFATKWFNSSTTSRLDTTRTPA
jgi:hypothetical protein